MTKTWCLLAAITAVSAGCRANDPQGPMPPPGCLGDRTGEDIAPAGATEGAAAIEALRTSLPFAGASVAVGVGSEVRWAQGFGQADPLTGLPATAETPFMIASVSKTVVGVLAMRLVEDGLLDLDADVSDLVGFPVRSPHHPEDPVTVRMLLTHTSTLWDTEDTWDRSHWTDGDATTTMHDFVRDYFVPGTELYGGRRAWWDAPPGEFYCYSNMAIATAAVALEVAGGAGLEDLARAEVFDPLGMDSTSYRIDAFCDEGLLARGVHARDVGFVAADNGPYGQPEGHPELASGMIRTSARDLLRFASAVGNGGELDGVRILDQTSVDAMLARQLDPALPTCGDGRGSPGEQGITWMHLPDAMGDWVGHYGGIEGFSAAMWVLPGEDLRYVVEVNQSDGAMNEIELAVLEHVDGVR